MRSLPCALLAIGLSAASLTAGDTDPRSLVEGGHWKQARVLLEPRVKANPSDAEAAALLSSVRAAYGDSDGALQLAERAVKLQPGIAAYHWQLAEIVGDEAEKASVFRQLGLARRFRQEAEAAISLDSQYIDARLGMISFFIKAPGILGGDRKKADAMAEEIARIDPGAGQLARAQVLKETKSTGDFETLFRQAADMATGLRVKYDATSSLINWYLTQKPQRYDDALQQARALLKIDPHRIGGYRGLAGILAGLRKWDQLDAVLADSEKAVPDDLSPFYRAASTIVVQGTDYVRAERYLRKYLTQEPEPSSPPAAYAHWRLGQMLEKEGKRAEAIADLEQCAKLKPDFEDGKKDLARVRAAR